jgi:hypothetical protein
MHTIWISPFAADATKVECPCIDRARRIWDVLHAAGYELSARP